MDNENTIVQLLTEIRDNQREQMKATQEAMATQKAALAKQFRNLLVNGFLLGVGIALLAVVMYFSR